MLQRLSHRLSASPDELFDRLESLIENHRRIEKEMKQQATSSALGQVDSLLARKQDIGGIPLIAAVAGEQPTDVLRNIMDAVRAKFASGVIVLGSHFEGKACLVASVSDDLIPKGLHAGKLIGVVAKVAGGGGGGQANKAQAGGKDGAKVGEAIASVAGFLKAMSGNPAS